MFQEPIARRGTLDYWVSLGNDGRHWIMERCIKCLATLPKVLYSQNVAFNEIKKFMEQCLSKDYQTYNITQSLPSFPKLTQQSSVHQVVVSCTVNILRGFSGDSDDRESACNVKDLGLIPGLGRSSGERNGDPLQHSFLENSMSRGAWQTTVHRVPKSQT